MKTSLKNAELVNTVIRKMMMIMFIAGKEMENVNINHISREKSLEAKKMITVNDLIKILDTEGNRYGATGKPRMLNLSLNGNFAGSIENVKLDGYGDGLVTDVTMKITSSKFTTTNADRIRNMSDEELLDFICSIETYEEGSVKTIENGVAMCSVTEIEKWLQSEAE